MSGLLQEDWPCAKPEIKRVLDLRAHPSVGPKEANRMAEWTTIEAFHCAKLRPLPWLMNAEHDCLAVACQI